MNNLKEIKKMNLRNRNVHTHNIGSAAGIIIFSDLSAYTIWVAATIVIAIDVNLYVFALPRAFSGIWTEIPVSIQWIDSISHSLSQNALNC